MLKIMAGFKFPEIKWNALFLLWPPPHHSCQDPHYNTAESRWCPEPPEAALDTFEHKAHALGPIKEASCFPGPEPTCCPWLA